MLILPKGGSGGGCSATGCLVDLNGACPADLRVARGTQGPSIACKSACEAFGDPRYCCSEAYNTPDTCGPSVYSLFFKHACPRAYSYAYDDKTSTYTCASADYVIIFCPPPYTRWIYYFSSWDLSLTTLMLWTCECSYVISYFHIIDHAGSFQKFRKLQWMKWQLNQTNNWVQGLFGKWVIDGKHWYLD